LVEVVVAEVEEEVVEVGSADPAADPVVVGAAVLEAVGAGTLAAVEIIPNRTGAAILVELGDQEATIPNRVGAVTLEQVENNRWVEAVLSILNQAQTLVEDSVEVRPRLEAVDLSILSLTMVAATAVTDPDTARVQLGLVERLVEQRCTATGLLDMEQTLEPVFREVWENTVEKVLARRRWVLE